MKVLAKRSLSVVGSRTTSMAPWCAVLVLQPPGLTSYNVAVDGRWK